MKSTCYRNSTSSFLPLRFDLYYYTLLLHLPFLVAQVVRIFNLFITYGDTFLPNPSTYDELYYELIRMQKVFEDVHAMGEYFGLPQIPMLSYCSAGWWCVIAKRYSTPEVHSEYHSSASQLATNLVNVRSIAAHFHPKINSWSTSNQVTSITPEQVYYGMCWWWLLLILVVFLICRY